MASFTRSSSMTNCDTIVLHEDEENMQQDEQVLNEAQKGPEKRLRENSEENDREEDYDGFVTEKNIQMRITNSLPIRSEAAILSHRDTLLKENNRTSNEISFEELCENKDEQRSEINKKQRKSRSRSRRHSKNTVPNTDWDEEVVVPPNKETNTSKINSVFSRMKAIVVKIKDVIYSKRTFEEKVCLCMQYIIKDVTSILCETFMSESIFNLLFENIQNG
ncbi:unnamed protein product [Arctia plantaginis]|uniref:Uncharacterized protein n=1 Tax=Arctia plantaginis TaxID=874455 RepID=A0A8S1ADL3_ARCPL|nr:unnamed protein product [Arctia plantaginis]